MTQEKALKIFKSLLFKHKYVKERIIHHIQKRLLIVCFQTKF